ncbi:MAG: hypothetical protein LBH41_01910 [Rickettsiales bacterium]|jgi:cell division protein FtsA|nr:hypothetical protein [Rickettsiales bacterium]
MAGVAKEIFGIISMGDGSILVAAARGGEVLSFAAERFAGPCAGQESLDRALSRVEKETGSTLSRAVFVVNWKFRLGFASSKIALGAGSPVSKGDMEKACKRLPASFRGVDSHRILHVVPIGYKVDGGEVSHDPRGRTGRVLAAACHVISAPASKVEEVEDLAAACRLSVIAIVSAPYACGLAVMKPGQSVLVIDIGELSFASALFYRGSVMSLCRADSGAGEITAEISATLGVPEPEAARLANIYGAATPEKTDFAALVDIASWDGRGGVGDKTVVRAEIMDAVRAAAFSWCYKAREFLTENAFACVDSVVLCGSGAMLEGLADVAHAVFGLPCCVAGAELKGASNPRFTEIRGAIAYMRDKAPAKPGGMFGMSGGSGGGPDGMFGGFDDKF